MARSRALDALVLAVAAIVLLSLPSGAQAKRFVGIDVSRFQGEIEWQAVADDGIRFAFVQASRGSGDDCTVKPRRCGRDRYFAVNRLGAAAVGIRVGAYHRAFIGGDGRAAVQADAKAEAALFIRRVGALERRELLPVLDVEPPYAGLDSGELVIWVRTWLRRVERALGQKPIIYTSRTGWAPLGDTTEFALAGHPLWVAHWRVRTPNVPAGNWAGFGWRVWQRSSDGRVDGIVGPVDVDVLRGGWRGVSVP